MQYKYKVSVIVPCYNVNLWLNDCLQSLVDQTLQEIEIICINDGSTDNTGKLLDDWQAKYINKIKIIHQKNGGLSNARNAGMQVAQGEYIGFVDADDWVETTMFAKMHQAAIINQAEVVHCDRYLYNQKTNKTISKKWQLPKNKLSTNKTIRHLQQYANGREGVCFFIFKNKFLQYHNISFVDNFTNFEDFPFLLQVCLQAKNIIHLDDNLYYYRQQHTQNRLSKYKNNKVFLFFQVFTYIKHILTDNDNQAIKSHVSMVQILTHVYAVRGINIKLLISYLIMASKDIFSYNSKKNIYQQAWILTRYKNIIYLPFVVLLNILYVFKNIFCHK